MTTFGIDYFSLLGRANNSFTTKLLSNKWREDTYDMKPLDVWRDAIVDISVISSDETIPEDEKDCGWEILNVSIDGIDLSTVLSTCVIIKRRKNCERLDHIVDIQLAHADAIMPDGYDVVGRSISGRPVAQLGCGLGYVCFKRANMSEISFVQGESMIDEITVISVANGEELPDNFKEIKVLKAPQTSKLLSAYTSSSSSNNNNASEVIIGYHLRAPIALANIAFEAATIDRYPLVDHSALPLPALELPMFAFPHGLKFKYSTKNSFPIPIFFSFVFTNMKGMRSFLFYYVPH